MDVLKNLPKAILMTSESPEFILNITDFVYQQGMSLEILLGGSSPESLSDLRVNGIDAGILNKIKINEQTKNIPILIYDTKPYRSVDFTLNLTVYDENDVKIGDTATIPVYRRYRINKYVNNYPTGRIINDDISFGVIRTNPRLSGNIKLVVDEEQNIYIDTFKVESSLNKSNVRKQQVSASGRFSKDISRVFKETPITDIYKLNDYDTYDVSIPKASLTKQISTTYMSGAYNLSDYLYKEDIAILAPIWLKNKLPDYFIVFRLDGAVNQETYTKVFDNKQLFKKFLRDGKIVKHWDLNKSTPLGTYLSKHINSISNVDEGIYLPLNNKGENKDSYEISPNIWKGISIKHGLIVESKEVPYDFEKITNYTDMNAHITDGYSRNGLLCPNLINMEFIFNDETADPNKMYRYYGFYMCSNEISKYNIIDNQRINIDEANNNTISNILDNGELKSDFRERVLISTDGNKINRLLRAQDLTNFDTTAKYKHTILDNKLPKMNFLTISVNDDFITCDHFIIKHNDKEYNIFGSDNSFYNDTFAYGSEVDNTIYCSFHVSDRQTTIKNIASALYKILPEYFSVSYRNNEISISCYSDTCAEFTYISGDLDNSYNRGEYLSIFGVKSPLLVDMGVLTGFELIGERKGFVSKFIESTGDNFIVIDTPEIITTKIVYKGVDEKYYQFADIYEGSKVIKSPYLDKWVIKPQDINPISLRGICLYELIDIVVNLMSFSFIKDFHFYINSKYRFDYNIDQINKIEVKPGQTITIPKYSYYEVSEGVGTFTTPESKIVTYNIGSTINTYNIEATEISLTATETTYLVCDNVTLTGNDIYKDVYDEKIDDYYIDDSERKRLKYGITTPHVCKWAYVNGIDCGLNPLRVMHTKSIFNDVYASEQPFMNMIPYNKYFNNMIALPVKKTLPDNLNRDLFNYTSINDYIDNNSGLTIKEMMLNKEHATTNWLYKTLFSSHQVYDPTKKRVSNLYYNRKTKRLETIFCGVKYCIQLSYDNQFVNDLSRYNNYNFSFITLNTASNTSNKPIEIFINEETCTMLLVYYSSNDNIDYSSIHNDKVFKKTFLNEGFNESGGIGCSFDQVYWDQHGYIKSDFLLNTALTVFKSTAHSTVDEDTVKFLQFSFNNISKKSSIIHSGNMTVPKENLFISFKNEDMYNTFEYNTYNNKLIKSADSFTRETTNTSFLYDYVKNIDCGDDQGLYIERMKKIMILPSNINLYIIRTDRVLSSIDIPTGSFININVENPLTYKSSVSEDTYNSYAGWISPLFEDIAVFDNNDIELGSKISRDLIHSNTKISHIKTIPEFWVNKYTKDITKDDITAGNAIINNDYMNIFSSNWDRNYFIESIDNNKVNINGFISNLEKKSFFGSKVFTAPREIEIGEWNMVNISSNITDKEFYSPIHTDKSLVLEYNISKSIEEIFINDDNFRKNWNVIRDYTTNVTKLMIDYINLSILPLYNHAIINAEWTIYKKPRKGEMILKRESESMEIVPNVTSELVFENGVYIYKITLPVDDTVSYYAKVKLKR